MNIKTPEVPLETLIKNRTTTRSFSEATPGKVEIEKIIAAGFYAPYAIIGSKGNPGIRKFFIVHKDTSAREQIQQLIEKKTSRLAIFSGNRIIRGIWRLFDKIIFRSNAAAWHYLDAHQLLMQSAETKGHFVNMRMAPYLIIIAEKVRHPHLTTFLIRQSLAHCLQNMWLYSTLLNLAFQPVSVCKFMSADKQVCKILGINPHEYELDGCLVGLPENMIAPKKRNFKSDEMVTWIP